MKEMDDLDIKAEIDEISKKIDAIIQNIDNLDPNKQEPNDSQNWFAPEMINGQVHGSDAGGWQTFSKSLLAQNL